MLPLLTQTLSYFHVQLKHSDSSIRSYRTGGNDLSSRTKYNSADDHPAGRRQAAPYESLSLVEPQEQYQVASLDRQGGPAGGNQVQTRKTPSENQDETLPRDGLKFESACSEGRIHPHANCNVPFTHSFCKFPDQKGGPGQTPFRALGTGDVENGKPWRRHLSSMLCSYTETVFTFTCDSNPILETFV